MAYILTEANDILIDFDGYKAYLTDDKLYVHEMLDASIPVSYLTTNNTDLGEPSVDKLLNYIDIDYTGTGLSLLIYYDGTYQTALTLPVSASRVQKQLWVRLDYRKPFQKVKFKIINTSISAFIYGIEIDFSVMLRRFHD